MNDLGKLLLIAGLALAAVGVLVMLSGRVPFLGRLPGDVTWRRGNTTVYFPVVTCLVVSAVLSLLLWLFRR